MDDMEKCQWHRCPFLIWLDRLLTIDDKHYHGEWHAHQSRCTCRVEIQAMVKRGEAPGKIESEYYCKILAPESPILSQLGTRE